MNADGSNQTRLTNNAGSTSAASFSPDGGKIAFPSNREGNDEIYVMNADGSNQTRLTNNAANDFQPSFSPDGSKIAFSSDRDGDGQIYVMNADGSNQTRLTDNTSNDYQPSFSPDGSKIVFVSHRDGDPGEFGEFEIYVMNADGSNQTRLTNSVAYELDPSFSPDGSKIAFSSDRDGSYQIYVMNADGSNPTRLTDTAPIFANFSPSFGGCQPVLIGLEITQGVQDLNNSVQLVEGKPTFVRAHVKGFSAVPISASAVLTAKKTATGSSTPISNSNVGGKINVSPNPVRETLDDSFLFKVPPDWSVGTVEFSFAGNQLLFACEAGGEECSKVTVTFHPVVAPSIKLLQLTSTDGALIKHTPTDADVRRVKKEFLGRYPINLLDSVTEARSTIFNPCVDDDLTDILKEINNWRNKDCKNGPCKDSYQGLVSDQSGCGTSPRH